MKTIRRGMLCLILMLLLAGCREKAASIEKNTLIVNSNRSLQAIVVDVLDKEYYDEKELRQYVEDEIYAYNYRKMATLINLDSLEFTENKVIVTLTYKTSDDYKEFNEQETFTGNIFGAMKYGCTFDGTFLDMKGNEVSIAKVTEDGSLGIIVVSEEMDIQVPENIVYISQNVEKTGKKTASTTAEGLSYIIYK